MGEKDLVVLEEYDIEVSRTGKGRDAMLCETDKGLMLLREYDGSEARAEAESWLLGELSKKLNVDGYMPNKEGKVMTVVQETRKYVLKKGISGREIEIKNPEEIFMAVRALAELHIELERIADSNVENTHMEQFKRERVFGEDILRHHKELKRIRNYIRGQRKKSDFELKVLECFNLFYEQGEAVVRYINKVSDGEQPGKLSLCHGNYNQHNILLGGGDISIINFEKAGLFYQVTDLYLFMRKCLEKHDFDVKLGLDIMKEYNAVKPLDVAEKDMLYVLFLYPEKFWKIVNHYYNGNKAWISQKSISKLQVVIEQEEERQKFLNNISNIL